MSPATVLPPFSRAKASYAQAITDELVEHHRREWSAEGKELVSAVLFGPLALGEFADTIELLEIVRGFPPSSPGTDPSAFEFRSTQFVPHGGAPAALGHEPGGVRAGHAGRRHRGASRAAPSIRVRYRQLRPARTRCRARAAACVTRLFPPSASTRGFAFAGRWRTPATPSCSRTPGARSPAWSHASMAGRWSPRRPWHARRLPSRGPRPRHRSGIG